MTIDLLDVDLHGVFEVGMTYVALSRGVSMERMRVTGFSAQSVRSNSKWGRVCGVRGRVVAFYTAIGQGRVFVPYRRSEGVAQSVVQSAVQRSVAQSGGSDKQQSRGGDYHPNNANNYHPNNANNYHPNNANNYHPNHANGFQNNANHIQKKRSDSQNTQRKREATPRQTNAPTTMPSQLRTKQVTPTPRKETTNSLVGLALALQQFNKSFSSSVWKQTRATKYIYKLFSLFDKSST